MPRQHGYSRTIAPLRYYDLRNEAHRSGDRTVVPLSTKELRQALGLALDQ